MSLIKKFVNYLFKIFNFKLIKINDQFSNSYRLVMAFKEKILILYLTLVPMRDNLLKI